MGAALLAKPETAADIISTLRRNLPHHVALSAKVRLLPGDPSQSLEFCRRLAACGVDAITVHARTAHERAETAAKWRDVGQLVTGLAPVPVILNGDVWGPADRIAAREVLEPEPNPEHHTESIWFGRHPVAVGS